MDPAKTIPKMVNVTGAGRSFGQRWGINPLLATMFFLVDFVLFGGEFFTAGVGLLVSIPVALVMGGLGFFVQRKKTGDSRGGAFVKSALLAVVTAIPGPMGAFLPVIQGILSLFSSSAPLPPVPPVRAQKVLSDDARGE